MVRSAIQVSGLFEESVLLPSLFAVLLLLPWLLHPASVVNAMAPAIDTASQRFKVSLFMFNTSLKNIIIKTLPKSDLSNLLTEFIAYYDQYKTYKSLYQANCSRITKLSALNTRPKYKDIESI